MDGSVREMKMSVLNMSHRIQRSRKLQPLVMVDVAAILDYC